MWADLVGSNLVGNVTIGRHSIGAKHYNINLCQQAEADGTKSEILWLPQVDVTVYLPCHAA